MELDESKGIVDRPTYEIRVFFVNNNRQKEALLPIIKKNIYTCREKIYDNKDFDVICSEARIYTDCWQSYQVKVFNDVGFILHRVNQSI